MIECTHCLSRMDIPEIGAEHGELPFCSVNCWEQHHGRDFWIEGVAI